MNTLLEHANPVTPLVDLSSVTLSRLRTLSSPELHRALRHVVEQSAIPRLCEQKRDDSWHD
jgi:hypothetical protein